MDQVPVWCRSRELKELGLAKSLWVEDDARPPDAETIDAAYMRITGKELAGMSSKTWSESWDGGDCIYCLDKEARQVVIWSASCDSEIIQLAPTIENFKSALFLIKEAMPMKHSPWCNGIHEQGHCEGEYQSAREYECLEKFVKDPPPRTF